MTTFYEARPKVEAEGRTIAIGSPMKARHPLFSCWFEESLQPASL